MGVLQPCPTQGVCLHVSPPEPGSKRLPKRCPAETRALSLHLALVANKRRLLSSQTSSVRRRPHRCGQRSLQVAAVLISRAVLHQELRGVAHIPVSALNPNPVDPQYQHRQARPSRLSATRSCVAYFVSFVCFSLPGRYRTQREGCNIWQSRALVGNFQDDLALTYNVTRRQCHPTHPRRPRHRTRCCTIPI
mgnify:CR=1 FL=1